MKPSRADGTNPRARRTNPRSKATNPSAGVPVDVARVHRETRRAYARLHAAGEHWCGRCLDSGHVLFLIGGSPYAFACPADRHAMTTADADLILHPD